MNYEETVYGWCPLDTTETPNKIWNRELLPLIQNKNAVPISFKKIVIPNSSEFNESNILHIDDPVQRSEKAFEIVKNRIIEKGEDENRRFETCDMSLPGIVLKNNDDTYTLLDGQHRLLRTLVTDTEKTSISCYVVEKSEFDPLVVDHNSFPLKSCCVSKKVNQKNVFGFPVPIYKRNKNKFNETHFLRHFTNEVVQVRFPELKRIKENVFENESQSFFRSVNTAYTTIEVTEGTCGLTLYNPMLEYIRYTEGYSNAMSMLANNLIEQSETLDLCKGDICVFYGGLSYSFEVQGKMIQKRYTADPIREYLNEETFGAFRIIEDEFRQN